MHPTHGRPPERPLRGQYSSFNPMQSACFDDAFRTDKSLVVCAPTGSGKTGVLELAIARLWSSVPQAGAPNGPLGSKVLVLVLAVLHAWLGN